MSVYTQLSPPWNIPQAGGERGGLCAPYAADSQSRPTGMGGDSNWPAVLWLRGLSCKWMQCLTPFIPSVPPAKIFILISYLQNRGLRASDLTAWSPSHLSVGSMIRIQVEMCGLTERLIKPKKSSVSVCFVRFDAKKWFVGTQRRKHW